MNIHSKGGIHTIKLDAAEQRTVKKFRELMSGLVLVASHLEMTNADLNESVYGRINRDGVFDPTPAKPEAKPEPAKGGAK